MTNKHESPISAGTTAQPRFHQRAAEIQAYGTVNHLLPIELEESVRLELTAQLNQLLADTMTLRDLYKKSHWQIAGPTFYQLHLLFDKHFDEQVELVDSIAERIQLLLGGVSIAMAHDVAEITRIERPPRGREEVPVQPLRSEGKTSGLPLFPGTKRSAGRVRTAKGLRDGVPALAQDGQTGPEPPVCIRFAG